MIMSGMQPRYARSYAPWWVGPSLPTRPARSRMKRTGSFWIAQSCTTWSYLVGWRGGGGVGGWGGAWEEGGGEAAAAAACAHPRWRKVEYTAQNGLMPSTARPAAKVTACCSAIPTSYVRLGKRLPKRSTPVPPGIAAVIATTERSLAAMSMSVSAKTEVYDGGPLGELAWGEGRRVGVSGEGRWGGGGREGGGGRGEGRAPSSPSRRRSGGRRGTCRRPARRAGSRSPSSSSRAGGRAGCRRGRGCSQGWAPGCPCRGRRRGRCSKTRAPRRACRPTPCRARTRRCARSPARGEEERGEERGAGERGRGAGGAARAPSAPPGGGSSPAGAP